MGTIVINQTDCKQNIVLESSLDGITGGYYDADGVWHVIGGGEILIADLTPRMQIGSLVDTASQNYFKADTTTRIGDRNFYTFPKGSKLKIKSAASVATAEYAINFYNIDALEKVQKHTNITNGTDETSDAIWKPFGTDLEVTAPETVNDKDIIALRVTVRESDQNPTIEENFVTKFEIYLIQE